MIEVQALLPNEWDHFSENAHLVCFNENRPKELNRIDFALLSSVGDKPVAYMTCREFDAESVYMQFGGAFPSVRGTSTSFFAYKSMVDFLSSRYKYASTMIQNTNTGMLKFAMKIGLRVIGTRTIKDQIFLEHWVEFGAQNE